VVTAIQIRQRWKRKGGKMEKDTEIMVISFENRLLDVEYDFYDSKKKCPVCKNNRVVFQIVEVKESETGFYVRDIDLKKRHQLRRAVIDSLDDAEPCVRHCKECGAEIEVIVPPHFTEQWLKDSAKADCEEAEKIDLVEASLELSPPDRFF
jgi:hypothetical protein